MDVLVLGGGYAGLLVAKKLERRLPDDVSLILVDETGDHLVQHELHRLVRRPGYVEDVVVPLVDLLDRADVVEARVQTVDRDARTVELGSGETLDYDVAAVCLGAETAFYGIDGLREHATPLKRVRHAAEIRREFLGLVDDADAGDERTAVVGGAGLSGVQVAGELAAFARGEDVDDRIRVVLLEQKADVVPGFPAKFREAVREKLAEYEVDVRTESAVTGVTDETVRLDGREDLTYDQLVWTGGIRGADAMAGERPEVRGHLRLDESTFVVGDAARVIDADGDPVPASAQAAVRASETAAHNVAEVVESRRTDGFAEFEQWAFDSPGWLVSVGDEAVAQVGSEVFTGRLAAVIKSTAGVTYLAEHGSLRRALGIVREELGEDASVGDVLREKL